MSRTGFNAMQHNHWPSASFILLLAILSGSPSACGEQLEAFTEPYKQIAIPAAEIGVISKMFVVEGDAVTEKQILAQLDDSVLTASLEVARAAKDALGTSRGAEADLDSRLKQLDSYRELRDRGNATQREVDRAENDHLQAMARLQSTQEELELRRLEYERVKAQIKQRRMESPINGIVVQIDKEVGEFVSPNDPTVMHVVQLDLLKSVFSVPSSAAKDLQPNQTVTLWIGTAQVECRGVIEFVSPVIDAQSASVRVKIRIPNPKGRLRGGDICRWDVNFDKPVDRVSGVTTNGNR